MGGAPVEVRSRRYPGFDPRALASQQGPGAGRQRREGIERCDAERRPGRRSVTDVREEGVFGARRSRSRDASIQPTRIGPSPYTLVRLEATTTLGARWRALPAQVPSSPHIVSNGAVDLVHEDGGPMPLRDPGDRHDRLVRGARTPLGLWRFVSATTRVREVIAASTRAGSSAKRSVAGRSNHVRRAPNPLGDAEHRLVRGTLDERLVSWRKERGVCGPERVRRSQRGQRFGGGYPVVPGDPRSRRLDPRRRDRRGEAARRAREWSRRHPAGRKVERHLSVVTPRPAQVRRRREHPGLPSRA